MCRRPFSIKIALPPRANWSTLFAPPIISSLLLDVTSVEEMKRLIDNGQARAGLIIPPDYQRRLLWGEQAQVAFVIDGSDPAIAGTALSAATLIGQMKATTILRATLEQRALGNAATAPLEVRTQVWYNPDLVSAYFMIPGLIGVILQFIAVILTSTAIVRERERGTMEQLIITPIRSWELLLGKLLPYILDRLLRLAGGVDYRHAGVQHAH